MSKVKEDIKNRLILVSGYAEVLLRNIDDNTTIEQDLDLVNKILSFVTPLQYQIKDLKKTGDQ